MSNDEWATPQDLYDKLSDEFDDFQLDVCATDENKKCHFHFTKEDNALEADWTIYEEPATCWMNPPYSRGNIDKFMEKAYNESLNGSTVVALVRDDPSAKWYRTWVDGKAFEVRRLARRVRFVGADSAYPFPCCVVIYDNTKESIYGDGSYDTYYNIWDWK